MTATTINEMTGETSTSESMWSFFYPDEVKQLLTPILARNGYSKTADEYPSVDYFLSTLEFQYWHHIKRIPWAIIFYPEEYPLLGHLLSIRPDPDSIKASAYSLFLRNSTIHRSKSVAPPLSFVSIFSKAALETTAASGSPLVSGVFDDLQTVEADGCWVHFADSLDPGWVASSAKTNDLLFSKITGIEL